MGCCPSKHKQAVNARSEAAHDVKLNDAQKTAEAASRDDDRVDETSPAIETSEAFLDDQKKLLHSQPPKHEQIDRSVPTQQGGNFSGEEISVGADPATSDDGIDALDAIHVSIRPPEDAKARETDVIQSNQEAENDTVITREASAKDESDAASISFSTLPSPSRRPTADTVPTSPSKRPVNFDEMPINSMYHRLHLVEVEEQEAKRQEELRSEAERHKREVQEFRAAMQSPSKG
ncbi:hypothetical protein PINS_up007862 [Pythium insidiosum]|nr:hypothetical protein PINS_up007862 [Pythium insidiosum]